MARVDVTCPGDPWSPCFDSQNNSVLVGEPSKGEGRIQGLYSLYLLEQSYKLSALLLFGGNCARALPDLSVLAAHNFSELGTEWFRERKKKCPSFVIGSHGAAQRLLKYGHKTSQRNRSGPLFIMCVVRQAKAIPRGVSYRMLQGQIINFIRKSQICAGDRKADSGAALLMEPTA